MNLDFSLVLVLATGLCGLIWAIDALLFARSRPVAATGEDPNLPIAVEYARSFFPILLLVLVIRSFLFEPFRIPSSSMMPTLLIGDFIFVNKYTYGLRLPVLHTKIVSVGEPSRGDVVVFRLPADPSTNYIKRLVGLPGDTVKYVNKRLYINDQPVDFRVLGPYEAAGQSRSLLARETLGDAEHSVLLTEGQRSLEGTFVIPQGYFFMMGDNRDNSRDSRYRGVGLVPAGNIVGKAVRIWMNWEIPKMPKWQRIGSAIQ
ncbi:MAG: signal peptidase I [Gammaproteobacteria bacterium]